MARKTLKGLLIAMGVVLALVAVLAVVAATFDWNRLRPVIARETRARLGREVRIGGNLRLHWSWTPRFEAEQVTIANASWARGGPLLTARRIEAGIAVLPLFKRRIEMTVAGLEDATIDLERDADGTGNWVLAKPGTPAEPGTKAPSKRTLAFVLENLELSGVRVTVAGDECLRINASAGNIGKGRAIHGRVALTAPHLTPLLRLFHMDVGAVPRLTASARLDGSGYHWSATGLSASLGDSRIAGNLEVDAGKRLYAKGDLSSPMLVVDDLLPFFGAHAHQKVEAPKPPPTPGPKPKATGPVEPVFPDGRIPLESLGLADADLSFKVKTVRLHASGPDLIDDGAMAMHLKHGDLRVQPLALTLALGRVEADVAVDARREPAKVALKALVSRVELGHLMAMAAQDVETAAAGKGAVGAAVAKEARRLPANTKGLLGGRADLTSTGSTPKELASHLSGHAGVALQDGRISDVLTHLVDADVAKAIGSFASGDKGSSVACFVADFDVDKGDAKADTVLLATSRTDVDGTGHVDLGKEFIDFKLTPHPKQVSLDSLRGSLFIKGPLRHPSVMLDPRNLLARVGAAVALGAVAAPAAAIVPFLEAGLGRDGACATHVHELIALKPRPGAVATPGDVPAAGAHAVSH